MNMPTKEEREAHRKIYGGVRGIDAKVDAISRLQAAQVAAQTPIAMLQGIQPPYFYGDEGEDVEAFIYALVNCASANDWKDNKTVSNLAHFLDGRAGYAFRAAVKHRVERAQGSQKEALETKRKTKEKLEQLREERDEASRDLRELGESIGTLNLKVKEEDDESKDGEESEIKKELEKLLELYSTATELFSTASVRLAEAKKDATAAGVTTVTSATATASEIEASHHSIAFPTLESALTWLRNTFRREDVEDKLTGDYFGRRQGHSETVQDYALELLKLSSRAGLTTSEEKQTKHFVDGLRPRLKKTLKHFLLVGKITAKPSDWEEMVKAAGALEREHPALKTTHPYETRNEYPGVSAMEESTKPTPSTTTESDTNPQEPSRTYQFDEFMAAVSALTDVVQASTEEQRGRDHNNSSRSKQCYNCHELGHLSWQCPSKPSQATQQWRSRKLAMPQFTPTCYRCNQVGHYSNNCPEAEGKGKGMPQQGAAQRTTGYRGRRNERTQDYPRNRERTGRNGLPTRDDKKQGNDPRA